MINTKIENQLYFKASRCIDSLKLAVGTFERYLKPEVAADSPDYYKARNYLREAETSFEGTLSEAKRLLGPLPAYAAADFEKWRSEFLNRHKIVAESIELNSLREELLRDEHLARWLAPEDVERLLLKNFEPQTKGKRRLANIKVRVVLDGLSMLLYRARELQKSSMEKMKVGA
jgi:predicted MPP superfamily phosphohydrolase